MDLRLTGDPTELIARFRVLTSRQELATFLGVPWEHLHHLAYTRRLRYRQFEVKKRRGGIRVLAEPITGLKIVQQKLNQVFYQLYNTREGVHGYVRERSVATNAQQHQARRWVLNVDLADFFPTIHFGRVRGMLIAAPYRVHADVATIVAQLCCYEGRLPQGAPTSPILANMVCARLDAELLLLARRSRAVYTRYADDITFSTDTPGVARRLVADADDHTSPVLSEELIKIIVNNGFAVNPDKIRLQPFSQRQVVTGLIVNRFPNVTRRYVRELRAMLYDWKNRGLAAADARFQFSYDTKDRGPHNQKVSFAAVVKGRIDYLGMIRGKTDRIYQKFLRAYAQLDKDYLPVPAKRRRPNHLRTYRDAIWVLEGDDGQGTMFHLNGVGWVTCDHVWNENMYAFHPLDTETRWPVRKIIGDRDIDLAIVEMDAAPVYAFDVSPRAPIIPGDRVKLAGFPHYAPGASLWEDSGRVVAHRHSMGYPRIMINIPTVTGASGGPVLDDRNRVVGVAAKGGESVQQAKERNENSVVPISSVDILLARLRAVQQQNEQPIEAAPMGSAESQSAVQST